jgi:hypothetical protein
MSGPAGAGDDNEARDGSSDAGGGGGGQAAVVHLGRVAIGWRGDCEDDQGVLAQAESEANFEQSEAK